jgi:hypothetical protein
MNIVCAGNLPLSYFIGLSHVEHVGRRVLESKKKFVPTSRSIGDAFHTLNLRRGCTRGTTVVTDPYRVT